MLLRKKLEVILVHDVGGYMDKANFFQVEKLL